jgi:PDDEXK-like domain of unknown function (DUF3799)
VSIQSLSADKYHADPAQAPSLSSSIAAILLEQSPQHAWLAHPRLNPNYVRDTDSRFDLGSAAHMMLLERREDRIVRVDADDWRTKAAKEARDQAQLEGKYAVLERQYKDIKEMCDAARKFLMRTELGNILDTGDAEQTLVWQDDAVWCRARPDIMSSDRKIVLDYKSTASAQPEAFARQIGRMGYDLQAEFYSDGVQIETGLRPAFVFLAQEITQPYACSLVALSNAYQFVGQQKAKRARDLWKTCLLEDSWPSYNPRIWYAEPKPWDLTVAEETL